MIMIENDAFGAIHDLNLSSLSFFFFFFPSLFVKVLQNTFDESTIRLHLLFISFMFVKFLEK